MANYPMMNSIKVEPDEESYSYINLSDQFHQSAAATATSAYFLKPASQIKAEPDENVGEELGGAVAVLADSVVPKVKEAKKRGRPKKPKEEGPVDEALAKTKSAEKKLKQDSLTEHLSVKKKRDRFNGMPEEEVLLRHLPDILAPNLDILIIGINPGLFAAYVGHHYAGPGNHFWKCLYLSGLIPEPMNAYDDFKLPKFGIGFTNICPRTTRGSSDLRKSEIKEGGEVLKRKIMKYRPRIAAFNGKGIYEVFSGKKDFSIGKQPETVDGTCTNIFVMPSSSARCAQLPRASDKVPFFLALRKLRDYLVGAVQHLDESEVVFPNIDMRLKPEIKCEKAEGSECAAELTPEEIHLRAEYLEALEASAEGREIPAEKMEKTLKRRLKGGSDDEDNGLMFEDEESSQSSGSYNTDGCNNSSSYGAYCFSKNTGGSSSFEVISSPGKEESVYNGQDDAGNRMLRSPSSKCDEAKLCGDTRAVCPSPKLSRPSPTFSPLAARKNCGSPSPLYTNLGSPNKALGAATSTASGKGSAAAKSTHTALAAWQPPQSPHSPSEAGPIGGMAASPLEYPGAQQRQQASPYMAPPLPAPSAVAPPSLPAPTLPPAAANSPHAHHYHHGYPTPSSNNNPASPFGGRCPATSPSAQQPAPNPYLAMNGATRPGPYYGHSGPPPHTNPNQYTGPPPLPHTNQYTGPPPPPHTNLNQYTTGPPPHPSQYTGTPPHPTPPYNHHATKSPRPPMAAMPHHHHHHHHQWPNGIASANPSSSATSSSSSMPPPPTTTTSTTTYPPYYTPNGGGGGIPPFLPSPSSSSSPSSNKATASLPLNGQPPHNGTMGDTKNPRNSGSFHGPSPSPSSYPVSSYYAC